MSEIDSCRDGHVPDCALVLNTSFLYLFCFCGLHREVPRSACSFVISSLTLTLSLGQTGWFARTFLSSLCIPPYLSHLRYRPAKLALANYLGKELSAIAALILFGKQIDQCVDRWLVFFLAMLRSSLPQSDFVILLELKHND